MFGPNTYIKEELDIIYSHRDERARLDFLECVSRIQSLFNLQSYEILLIPGGGTFAIEAVIHSLSRQVQVVGPQGKFSNRWKELALKYNRPHTYPLNMACHLETSTGSLYDFYEHASIVDAISSFPYYSIPKDTDIFVTCSNKQLGALSGIGIVGIRKTKIDELILKSNDFSILNLSLYLEYAKKGQTPTTPPVGTIRSLRQALNLAYGQSLGHKFDLQIEPVAKKLREIFESYLIGDEVDPVITLSRSAFSDNFAKKWEIYGHNNPEAPYQIFTYSAPEEQYDEFIQDYRQCQY